MSRDIGSPPQTDLLLTSVDDVTPLNKRISGVRVYLSKAARLFWPFWRSPESRAKAVVLTMVLLVVELLELGLAARVSYAMADVLNILDRREFEAFWPAFSFWMALLAAGLAVYAAQFWAQYHLLFYWREFLTHRYLQKYLQNGLFHQMELTPYGVDNPDQRIAVDIDQVTSHTLTWVTGFFSAVGTGIVFGVILWEVSGPLAVEAFGQTFEIPGYMFWTAVLYAGAMLWITDKLGRPIIALTYQHHTVEADFRYHLIRLREYSESIALLEGEKREFEESRARFHNIRLNWLRLWYYRLRLQILLMMSFRLSSVFPYIAAMPALISGAIALGGFVQLREAWGRLQGSLSWFSSAYPGLAAWKASVDRLLILDEGIQKAGEDSAESLIAYTTHDGTDFRISDLNVALPNGELLLEQVSFDLQLGRSVLISGETGSGKSTLFRVLSGHWIWGAGKIEAPSGNVMFLPQKPYLPLGTLRDAFSYPNTSKQTVDADLTAYLKSCKLDHLVEVMDETRDWSKTLSGGEQQRLSIIRAFVEKPDWLFLDEASSAMDSAIEEMVYRAIQTFLPKTTIVSIAHRESLKRFHARELRLDRENKAIKVLELSNMV